MMKFNCEKHILQEAVGIASRAVSPRSALPVLEGILLEAEGDTLKLTGYDLKKAVFTTADCSTATAGAAVLNAKLLSEIVRSMPDGLVNITVEDNIAIIRCGKSEYTIPAMQAKDFPELPEFEEGEVLTAEESEEMIEIAGGIPLIEETDEVILEGDIRFVDPDAGETP